MRKRNENRGIDRHQTKPDPDSRVPQKKEIRCLKTGSIPAKADPVAQRKFLEDTMEPVIAEAKRGDCVLDYMDAAHCVMGSILCYTQQRR